MNYAVKELALRHDLTMTQAETAHLQQVYMDYSWGGVEPNGDVILLKPDTMETTAGIRVKPSGSVTRY